MAPALKAHFVASYAVDVCEGAGTLHARDSSLGSYAEELTPDQIAYLRELADERRRVWAQHKAAAAAGDTSK